MHDLVSMDLGGIRTAKSDCDDLSRVAPLTAAGGIRLLVIDLDGTLIDSSRDLCTAVNAALGHAGRPTLSEATINSFIGDGAAALVRRSLDATGGESHETVGPLFESTLAYFINFYREHKLDTTKLYPGVMESLREVRERSPQLLMAVLTNKPVTPSVEICAALEIAPFFFAIYGGNSFPTKKPAPEGLTRIIREGQQLRAARWLLSETRGPAEVVMIGDSDADVQGGRACGTRTLGCSYGLAPDLLRKARPDAIVSTAYAWPSALGL